MPQQEIQIFEPRMIARGPDEIRGQVGSFAFIYTRYPDSKGNRCWKAMLVVVLGHLGVGGEDDVVVVVGDTRQFWAKDFFRDSPS